MPCVCPFASGAQRSRRVSVGRRAVGVQGRTSRPGDRVLARSGDHGLDVDVDGVERRAVVVLGHVDTQGGSRGNLRAAVDQRADRFFSPKHSDPPAPPRGPPIASHCGRVLGERAEVREGRTTALGRRQRLPSE